MAWVHPDDIVIPENRFRREFDEKALADLRASILRNGLLHAVTVEKEGDTYVLRGGERRYRVCKALIAEGHEIRHGNERMGFVPVVDYDTLSELERLEIEVEENVIRADFKWQERLKAIEALDKLRRAQNPQQTIKATASEILGREAQGEQIQRVSDALVVARHLDMPEISGAKDEKEALKRLKKIKEAGHMAKLAKDFDLTTTKHKVLLQPMEGDPLAVLRALEPAQFDVVVSDPPYGIGADGFGSQSAQGHDYADSYKYWKELMAEVPDQLERVCKPASHCYLFCDWRRFEELSNLMVLANWTVFPVPLIWHKENGMLPFPDFGPRRTYECILFAWRGDRKQLVVKGDVITRIPAVKTLRHGAQKPVALYEELLSRCAKPGDAVLDPFGGSGPILVAANRRRLIATYIEREEAAFNIALSRATVREIDDGAEADDGLGDFQV